MEDDEEKDYYTEKIKAKMHFELPDFVLPAASLSKIGDWCELGVNRTCVKPAVVDIANSFFCVLLFFELTRNTIVLIVE